MNDAQAAAARHFRWQAEWCGRLRSPLYEALLANAAADIEEGGPTWTAIEGARRHLEKPRRSMVALRLMGAVHRLVLEGELPELARFYPSAGGTANPDRAWPVFREALDREHGRIAPLIDMPVQTNEPGRSAALLAGFLLVAAETGLPLRLLEVGASAGLNLRWDRYCYTAGNDVWGDPASPLRFEDAFTEGRPPAVRPEIADRRGCDAQPLDPASERDRVTLVSYVWPDQEQRLAVLRAALELSASVAAAIARQDAAGWVEREVADDRPGAATVVFHSIVMQYLDEGSRERMRAAIEQAGRRATPDAPLAWLRMEPGRDQAEVRLTLWPDGRERLIALAGYHGPPVRLLA